MPRYKNAQEIKDPDSLRCPMHGIAVDDYLTNHGAHSHKKAQLLYCSRGVIHFYCHTHYFLLPPSKAAWIPAGWTHDIRSSSKVCYRSLYIETEYFKPLPSQMTIFNVDPLLKLLIEKACSFETNYNLESAEFRLAQVIIDEMNKAKTLPFYIPMPKDDRLKRLFDYFFNQPDARETIDSIAAQLHITSRTLTRLCHNDLGMGFEKWRLQFKLYHAFLLLEEGHSVTYVSQCLGYSSDSSFIARFKQSTGETPASYRRQHKKNAG